MTLTFRAVFEGGVLRPVQPLALAEGETVEVIVTSAPVLEDDIIRRIQACKTYREWFAVMKDLPDDDGGYDIVKALDENRRWSGEQPLLPGQSNLP